MSVISKQKLLAKLRNKAYRDAYVAEHVKTSVPIQVRTLREQHELTQSQLAERAKTTQTVISRIEDPNYGNLSINSLLKIASGLDVALLVKFVPFSRLLNEFKDVSPEAIAAESFDKEIEKLERWANDVVLPVNTETTPNDPRFVVDAFIGNPATHIIEDTLLGCEIPQYNINVPVGALVRYRNLGVRVISPLDSFGFEEYEYLRPQVPSVETARVLEEEELQIPQTNTEGAARLYAVVGSTAQTKQ